MKKNNFTKTLAVVTTAFAVGSVFFAISAKAEENYVKKYSCTNEEFHTVVIAHEQNAAGTQNALVHLNTHTRAGIKTYLATYEQIKIGSYQYKLSEGEGEVGTLKIITQKLVGRGGGFCGRAGCDMPGFSTPVYSVYAALKIGEYEDSFECN